jgi:hypothetical protein
MAEHRAGAVLSLAEMYNLVREQIEHEDNLITQRLSWLVASQSFLFTAFAILLNAPPQGKLPAFDAKQAQIFQLIPLVGLLSDLLIYVSIVAGVIATSKLRAHWLAVRRGDADDRQLPAIQGPRLSQLMGLVAPLLLPLVFLVIWAYVLAS